MPKIYNRVGKINKTINMKTNILKATLAVVCVVAAGTGSWKAYSAYNGGQSEMNDLLQENIEALSDDGGEDNGVYPRYKNDGWKRAYNETKVEVEKDSLGRSFNVTFKRNCSSVITTCKYTGDNADNCYGALNGVITDCEEWVRN